MANATLTSKGQVTIPKEIRKHLSLKDHDKVTFLVQKDGSVTIRPALRHPRELKGMLESRCKRAVSVEEMNRAIRTRKT